MKRSARTKKVLIFLLVVVAAIVLLGAILLRPIGPHLRALSLLLRFSNPKAQGFTASFAQHPFKEEDGSAQTPRGLLRYRLYTPQDVKAIKFDLQAGMPAEVIVPTRPRTLFEYLLGPLRDEITRAFRER